MTSSIDTSSMKETAGVLITFGLIASPFGAALLIGAWYALDPGVTAGMDVMTRIGYHGSAPLVLTAIGLVCQLPMIDGIRRLVDAHNAGKGNACGKNEVHTPYIEPVNIGAIHYDGDYSKSYPVSVDGEHYVMDSQGNLTKE